jgi:GTP-binding protein
MKFLGNNQIPFCIVFTKADKLGSSKLNKQIVSYKKKLLNTWETLPTSFITSSSTGLGKDEFLEFISTVNDDVVDNFK